VPDDGTGRSQLGQYGDVPASRPGCVGGMDLSLEVIGQGHVRTVAPNGGQN